MSSLFEKFVKNMPNREVVTVAQTMLENNLVHPLHTSSESFTTEILFNDDLFESSLKIQDRQLLAKCSCGCKELCSHLLASLYLADKCRDLQFALKRNIKSNLIINPKTATTIADTYEFYQETQTTIKPKAAPTFELFPNFEPVLQDKIIKFRQQLTASSFSPSDDLIINAVININESILKQRLILQLYYKIKNPDNSYTKRIALSDVSDLPENYSAIKQLAVFQHRPIPIAKQLVDTLPNVFSLPPEAAYTFLPLLTSYNVCYARKSCHEKQIWPIKLQSDWQLSLDFTQNHEGFCVSAYITKGEDKVSLAHCDWICEAGFALKQQNLFIFNTYNSENFIIALSEAKPLALSYAQLDPWLNSLLVCSNYPVNALPKILQKSVVNGASPKGKIHIRTAKYKYRGKEQLHADVNFLYNGSFVKDFSHDAKVASFHDNCIYARNSALEEAMRTQLKELGFRFNNSNGREEYGWKLLPNLLDQVVRSLVEKDWVVTANGKSYLKPSDMKIKISSSNADWFDLKIDANCQDQPLPLPEIIKAIKNKQDFVRLDDGSIGMLPLEWLKYFTVLTEIGLPEGENLKFRRSQLIILNEFIAKLIPKENVSIDSVISEIKSFNNITAIDPPNTFNGSLRHYQKEALGWMHFLQKYNFGGILADDMGLGKTVQILALLESRRTVAKKPSLIVMPRSLIFNWFEEAKKFTPNQRVLIHSGANRQRSGENFKNYDIVLTTYGTLVRDVTNFVMHFDYCILDESQNIKNAQTQNAKAAIAVQCDYRLCLSGTPVENSISELISQFQFLNPEIAKCLPALSNPNIQEINSLRRSIKPFILRRTKQEVAKELPPKVEQIIYCQMTDNQSQHYSQMREFYRQKLIVNQKDPQKDPIQMLAALMRLRQIACHPGLVDPALKSQPSAKIDFLLDQITTLVAENHKLIIFSQFRTLLQIVAENLNSQKLPFAYIDGTVKDRQSEVEKFQNQDDTKIFLISLKAGGTGLNLTAAEYVFILDPWWNPAAEAQAVDRAYRIGQTKTVFAYRLICHDTVEEKILEMKNRKQQLADSLVNDAPLNISDLTAADLEQIFG